MLLTQRFYNWMNTLPDFDESEYGMLIKQHADALASATQTITEMLVTQPFNLGPMLSGLYVVWFVAGYADMPVFAVFDAAKDAVMDGIVDYIRQALDGEPLESPMVLSHLCPAALMREMQDMAIAAYMDVARRAGGDFDLFMKYILRFNVIFYAGGIQARLERNNANGPIPEPFERAFEEEPDE